VNQKLDQRQTSAVQFRLFNFLRRHFADDFVEGAFGNAFQFAAEKDFAGADGFRRSVRAVNQIGHRFGQSPVRFARAGIFRVFLFQRLNFFLRQKREVFQVADHVPVVGVDPELVEAIDAGAFRVEPDGPDLGFAEFRAVGVGDERQRQTVNCFAEFLAREVNAGGDVAPLVAAARFAVRNWRRGKAP